MDIVNSEAKPRARRRRRQRGASVVEFVFVLIPMLAMLFMSFDLAWMFFGWACIQQAVREGVRYGVTAPVTSGLDNAIKQFVTNMSIGFISTANHGTITVQYFSPTTMAEVTGQPGATTSGNVLKVTATVTISTLVPIWQSSSTRFGTFIAWNPTLAAGAADVLATGQTPPSE